MEEEAPGKGLMSAPPWDNFPEKSGSHHNWVGKSFIRGLTHVPYEDGDLRIPGKAGKGPDRQIIPSLAMPGKRTPRDEDIWGTMLRPLLTG